MHVQAWMGEMPLFTWNELKMLNTVCAIKWGNALIGRVFCRRNGVLPILFLPGALHRRLCSRHPALAAAAARRRRRAGLAARGGAAVGPDRGQHPQAQAAGRTHHLERQADAFYELQCG